MLTLEALVVGTLLLVALENTMAAVSASSDLTGHEKRMTEALHVGQGLMEDLMLAYDTDANLTAGAHSAQYDTDGTPVAGGMYTANWVVTPDSPYPNVRTIEITLSWTEKGTARVTVFTTYRN
jgi:hypothetical protein